MYIFIFHLLFIYIVSFTRKNKGDLPTGVCWHKRNKKYQADIRIDGKPKYLGSYDTIEEAEQCYTSARNEYARALAKKYQGLVEDRVYEVLMRYDEEIFI